MGARALIEAAMAALDAFTQAQEAVSVAAQTLQQASQALDAADKALHDELASGGAVLYIDESTTPPTYTVYTAAEPDTYTATPIRIAA